MAPPNKAAAWLMSLLSLTTLTGAAPSKDRHSETSIKWEECEPTRIKCATVKVRADWTKPNGPQITLDMNMLPAKESKKRLGYLFMNPGGPGGSVTENAVTNEERGLWSDDVRNHYDIIGVDPRGIGTSTQILCDPDLFNKRPSLRPSTEKEFDDMVSYWREFSESCRKLTKPSELYSLVDTVSFIQDLEAVRKAVGEEKCTYIGLSYGTQVGQQYAARYPDTVGRMVLDANVDHSLPETAMAYIDALTYEDVAKKFFTWADQNETSVLHGQDVAQFFDSLAGNATAQPIPVPKTVEGFSELKADVTGQEIRIWMHDALAFTGAWTGVAQALKEASDGNATLVTRPLAVGTNSSLWGGYAVACQRRSSQVNLRRVSRQEDHDRFPRHAYPRARHLLDDADNMHWLDSSAGQSPKDRKCGYGRADLVLECPV